MCDFSTAFTVASTLFSAYGQMQQASYQSDMAEYNAAVARNNAMVADWQAKDATARGSIAEERQRVKVRQMIGAQRAQGAAQGLLVDSGSLGALTDETAKFGEEDAQMIRVNAMREAFGYQTDAGNYRAQSAALRSNADAYTTQGYFNAGGTLLAGVSSIGDKYGWWKPASTSSVPTYGSSSLPKTNWWEG